MSSPVTLEEGNNDTTVQSPLLVGTEHPRSPTSGAGGAMSQVWFRKLQTTCHVAAHVLTLIALILVWNWIVQLGGLVPPLGRSSTGKAKQVFNWHPLLMITAYCFMTISALAFRNQQRFLLCGGGGSAAASPLQRQQRRLQLKWLHGLGWLVAAICASIALVAVVQAHNDATSGLIANAYSLHSWFGGVVIVCYILQFTVGVATFVPLQGLLRNVLSPATKANILVIHKMIVGPYVYVATGATILLGIQEKEGFVNCSYKVEGSTPDHLWPSFGRIPPVCLTSHALGLIVLLMTLTTSIAMSSNNHGGVPASGAGSSLPPPTTEYGTTSGAADDISNGRSREE